MLNHLYRAKIQGTNEWVIGYPHSVYGNGIDSIQSYGNHKQIEYIKIETLCRSLYINNSLYFEKDILEYWGNNDREKVLISYNFDGFYINKDRFTKILASQNFDLIGNEIDNLELLLS